MPQGATIFAEIYGILPKKIFFAASLKAWKKFDMLAVSWHDVEGRTVLICQWKHQEQQNLFYVNKPPFQ